MGVFLVCAVALELILRFNGYGNLEIYEPDSTLYWKLKPNQNCYTKIGHQPVHINSHGTRGREFEETKASNTIRVLCLGDSRTFGWGLKEEETYPELLAALLQKQNQSRKIEVINAGVNAWSYPQMLVYLRNTAIRYEPDILILGEANLWTQFSEKNSPEFVRKFMNRVRMKNILRRFATYHFIVEVKLKEFYERNRTRFIPVDPAQDTLFKQQQQSNPESLFRGTIEEICRLAQERRIKPVLLYLPSLDEAQSTNSTTVLKVKRELGESLNLPVVDLTPAVRTNGKALYLEADPIHYNALGNSMIAQRLYESLMNAVVP